MPKEDMFVSIGDNCEFGFVQRKAGVEDGSLLRWSISPPSPLARAIRTSFTGIYAYENLIPAARRMVRDTESGLAFHTSMFSTDGVFDAPDAERLAIWREEIGKIIHLRSKFNEIMDRGEKILVYKRNSGVTEAELTNLVSAVRERSNCPLLYVEISKEDAPGTVRYTGDNLYIGKIDRFAPYSRADDCSYQVWDAILTATVEMACNSCNTATIPARPESGR